MLSDNWAKRKFETAIDRSGMIVDECTHSDLAEIMKEQNNAFAAKYPTDSFPRVFWEQQLKMATTHDSRGQKWHPVMIKWALYLQYQSSSTYKALRFSGCVALPSQRTLDAFEQSLSTDQCNESFGNNDVCHHGTWYVHQTTVPIRTIPGEKHNWSWALWSLLGNGFPAREMYSQSSGSDFWWSQT